MNTRIFKIFFISGILWLFCLPSAAQKWDHALDFSYYFDNREFDRGSEAYAESMTLYAARLTPYLGLRFDTEAGTTHRVMAGLDIYKEMGDGRKSKALLDELSLYYEYSHKDRKHSSFQLVAGVFPRSYSEGSYSRVIFSDATLFTDHNIEGLLLKHRTKRFYGEIYCDWMGKYGYTSRERFQINSAGKLKLWPVLGLGWDASLYHYSCSELEHYVVDNALANLYAELDLSRPLGLQQCSLRSGVLAGYQRDRRWKTKHIPTGSESILTVGMWNFAIENSFVYAPDMLVYYDGYGDALYYGSPFYHTDSSGHQAYDRLELYWDKKLGKLVTLKLSAVMHFARGTAGEALAYQGMQQRVALNFDFGKLR